MKIVYCIPSLHNSGGMERVLTVKANYLAEVHGWDVTIVTTSQKGGKMFYTLNPNVKHIDLDIDYESIMQMPMHKRIMARIKAKPLHRKRLTEVLFNERPDVTVSMFTHEMFFLPDIDDGSKKVLELHFSKQFRKLDAISNNAGRIKRAINAVLDWTDRRKISNYDKFIVLSHQDAEDWKSVVNNVGVISNPASFSPSENDRVDYSAQKVLAIGRLCPQKGFDILINAWSLIPSEVRGGWSLDIVGSGPDYDKLLKQIKEKNLEKEIKILPPVKNVQELYLSHSIFCFPSRYEGFGLTLMEAMSFGLACVACDCPCGPRELIYNEQAGFLVARESSKEVSSALTKLMASENLRRSIGEVAKRSIQERFSLKAIMEKWHTLFSNLRK